LLLKINLSYLYKKNTTALLIFFLVFVCQNALFGSDARSILDSLKLPIHDTVKGRLMGKLAWSYKFENQKESLRLATEELAIGEKYNNALLLMDGHRAVGFHYIISRKYIDGFTHYDKSLAYAQSATNYFYLATVNSLIAGAYYDQSEFNTSVSYYYKGLDYALKSKNEKVISMLRLNLAAVYTTTNTSLDKAETLLKAALNADLKNKNFAPAALISSSIAELYSRNSKIDSASKYLSLANQLIQKDNKDPFLNGQVNMSIAGTYFLLKNYTEAKKYCLKGIEIFEPLHTTLYTLPAYEILTNCAIEEKQLNQAKQYALTLLKHAEENKSKVEICNSYELLSKIEKQEGDYKQSLFYYEKFKIWNDSLIEEKKLERIANMDFKAQTELKLKENEQLESQNQGLKRNLILTLIGLFWVGCMAFYLYKSIQTKRKLNNELEIKNKLVEQQVVDKTILLQEVHHRVKNNLTMINSLLYLQSKDIQSDETKNVLTEFQHRIRSIAIIHSKLYEEANISSLDFNVFIQSIFDELVQSFSNINKPVHLHIIGNCSPLDITTSVTLGLIYNELMTNSLKYAFHNVEEGTVEIKISEKEGNFSIQYQDNGPGLKTNFDESNGNFGFKLLHLLPKQIGGNMSYKKGIRNYFELIFEDPS
jgi:two-component system, sensor histidine kinase PdtaS